MKRVCGASLAMGLCVASAWAQLNTDEWIDIPLNGGSMHAGVAIDPLDHNHLFTVSGASPTKLWESHNAGDLWTFRQTIPTGSGSGAPGGLYYLEFGDGPTSTTLYAGRLISYDSGATFSEMTSAPGWIAAVDPTNPQILYASRQNSDLTAPTTVVFKSVDGGATWNPTGLALANVNAVDVDVDPSDPQILVAGTRYNNAAGAPSSGMYRSMDRGATWTHVLDDALVMQVKRLPSDPAVILTACWWTDETTQGVWRSADHGATWSRVYTTWTSNLTISPEEPNVVYLNSWTSFWRSDDGGQTWGLGLYLPSIVRQITASGAVGSGPTKTIYVGSTAVGVFRSRDGGQTWEEINNGMCDNSVGDICEDPDNPARLFAMTERGLYRIQMSEPRVIELIYDFGNLGREVAFDQVDHNVVYGTADASIGYSAEKGDHFTHQFSTQYFYWLDFTQCGSPQAILGSPWTAHRFFVGVERRDDPTLGGLYVSNDMTQHFEQTPLFNNPVKALGSGPVPGGMAMYLGSRGGDDRFTGVYRSADDGQTWPAAGLVDILRIDRLAVDPADGNHLFAAGKQTAAAGGKGKRIYRTHDGGQNWTNVTPPNALTSGGASIIDMVIDPLNPNRVVVAYETLIIQSEGDGDAWTLVASGLENVGSIYLSTTPIAEGFQRADAADVIRNRLFAGTNGSLFQYQGDSSSSVEGWREYR
ncbi:MAG: hypothetical protein NTW86_16955 [Candidatus Sumerlaeota bacterium]|nr:hypothetical protein [Candidatus Sumerlaeota bacterium]